MSEFNTYSISIKGKNGIYFEGELINKKEVDHALQNLKSELEKTSSDLKVAQEELKNSKEKLLQAQTKLNATQDELKAKQEKLDEHKEKLKDVKNELEKVKNALEITQNELKVEKDKANNFKDKLSSALNELEKVKNALEITQNELKVEKDKANNFKDKLSSALNELEKTQNELDNIKENTHFSLYKYYQTNKENLREFFNSNDFKDQCEFIFKTIDTKKIEQLYQIIKIKISSKSDNTQHYIDFFEKLYSAVEKYDNNLKRIETKEGEKYDNTIHMRIEGGQHGQIKKVFFIGFKVSNVTYKSFVELE
ncbi:hypothetical protein CINS5955_07135 [Campylobacter insulaenigrae]|uniref:coiled-coil domain-containing protein n=1 Tax=Campylobacter insulaenigrae TaxID=260714 RepID=UPI002152DBD2|nr:hypothetical protein [Campylobacter insulaenigrae]MCR6579211.1 hypothetical protein [Campylobacter insulaenigrae]